MNMTLKFKIAKIIKSAQRKVARRKKAREKRSAEIAARIPGEGYEPCIVSYIDVLGFRDLLENRHAHDIRDILQNLREFTRPEHSDQTRREKAARLYSHTYSDSVSDAIVRMRVFNTQYHDGAFYHELSDLIDAQIQCILNGVIIRAGVTIGDAHVGANGKGPLFGPAMVRAYEIESKEAVYPRIVVDKNAYETFLKDSRLHKDGHTPKMERDYIDKLLRLDDKGIRFLDYLAAAESYFECPLDYFGFLDSHAKLVRGNLNSTDARVQEKFKWLASYHNEVIKQIITDFSTGKRPAEIFQKEFNCSPTVYFDRLFVELPSGCMKLKDIFFYFFK